MKQIIKKSIITITAFAIMLTLAMPVSTEAARKKAPKLNKTKTTLTITKKKTKPAVQLKVKNAAGRKVKWATINKKVVTVSKNGKVVAKKKGSAVITVKVKGSKTLRCKVTVKDNRKPVTKPNPNPAPKPDGECEHVWVEKTTRKSITICTCGKEFQTTNEWEEHSLEKKLEGETNGHSFRTQEITTVEYLYCLKCGIRK